jgi:hypothetical protein
MSKLMKRPGSHTDISRNATTTGNFPSAENGQEGENRCYHFEENSNDLDMSSVRRYASLDDSGA